MPTTTLSTGDSKAEPVNSKDEKEEISDSPKATPQKRVERTTAKTVSRIETKPAPTPKEPTTAPAEKAVAAPPAPVQAEGRVGEGVSVPVAPTASEGAAGGEAPAARPSIEAAPAEQVAPTTEAAKPTEVPVEEKKEKEGRAGEVATITAPVTAAPTEAKDEMLEGVENILIEDLDVLYRELSAEKQEEFKIKGEETAKKVTALLKTAKIKIKEIILVISSWLRIIPRANSYFVEKEAKIKVDKLLRYAEEQKKLRKELVPPKDAKDI